MSEVRRNCFAECMFLSLPFSNFVSFILFLISCNNSLTFLTLWAEFSSLISSEPFSVIPFANSFFIFHDLYFCWDCMNLGILNTRVFDALLECSFIFQHEHLSDSIWCSSDRDLEFVTEPSVKLSCSSGDVVCSSVLIFNLLSVRTTRVFQIFTWVKLILIFLWC